MPGTNVFNRIGQSIITVVGASFLIFAAVFVLPGDALDSLVGDNPVTPTVEAALRAKYNLDGNLFQQYWGYITAVANGDFGQTVDGRDVSQMLSNAWPITVQLALTAWVLELAIGIAIGVISAMRPNGIFDRVSWVFTLLSLALPTFAVALILQHYLALDLKLFPVAGTLQGWPGSYLLPALCLALLGFGSTARLARVSVANTKDSDFVRLARARGVSRPRIVLDYVLRPGLVPLVTHLGTSLSALLGGAVIIEAVFNLGGVGSILVSAISRREGSSVVGIVTLLVVLVAVVNIVIDISYRFLDPRMRRA